MSLRDAYLRGSDVLGGTRSSAAVEIEAPGTTAADAAIREAEQVVAEAEAGELLPRVGASVLADAAVRPLPRVLKSELPNVSDQAWTRFVFAMKVAQPGAISASNALGMFELKARRLADLGLVRDIKRARSPLGRLMWVGEFTAPLTQREFLNRPELQYKAFVDSMRAYVNGLRDATVPRPNGGFPADMTLSGALAVLHRGGPGALRDWNNEDDRFEDTVALFDRTNGIF